MEAKETLEQSIESTAASDDGAGDDSAQLQNVTKRTNDAEELARVATDKLASIQERAVESEKSAGDAIVRQANESRRRERLGEEVNALIAKLGEPFKARDTAVRETEDRGSQARVLKARVRLLRDELDSLMRRDYINCNVDVTARKVKKAKGYVSKTIMDLHRCTVDSHN